MGFIVTPERAIWFTKLTVTLTRTWPPPLKATKRQILFSNVLWYSAFASTIGLLVPLLSAAYEYNKDPMILGKTVCLFSAVAQVTIKMMICRLQQRRFQTLLDEMECFCKYATTEETATLQRHVDRYKSYHIVYTLWGFLTCIFVISSPLFLPQTFPTHAKYPFPVEEQPLKSFIYLHQSLVGFQCSGGMAIDGQVALLLRYVVARFEILGMRLSRVQNQRELDDCIRTHSQLLRYSKEACQAVRLLVLATISTTNVAVIFGSLNLVTNQPLLLKVIYAVVVFSASVELFMYAWPADTLIDVSARTAQFAYDTNWYEKDAKMQKKILYIIQRSQRLNSIRFNGILPNLSMSYYATYLYRAFSYFTAIRIMVESGHMHTYVSRIHKQFYELVCFCRSSHLLYKAGELEPMLIREQEELASSNPTMTNSANSSNLLALYSMYMLMTIYCIQLPDILQLVTSYMSGVLYKSLIAVENCLQVILEARNAWCTLDTSHNSEQHLLLSALRAMAVIGSGIGEEGYAQYFNTLESTAKEASRPCVMFGHVTLGKAIQFTRLSVALTCCWPTPPTATEFQVLRFKTFRCAVILNAFTLLLPLLYALYVHRDDSIEVSKAACLAMAVTQLLLQTFFCITQYDRFQRLIHEMSVCCKEANSYERHVYQRYIDKYSTFYGTSAVWFYLTASLMVVGTFFISQPFPTNAEYPFPVNHEPLATIIFLHQALVGMQCAAHVCVNIFGALLLLFAAARFEILTMELRSIMDIRDLIKCLKKYHRVKRYAQEVTNAVRFIALITIAMCGVAIVLCGINCIGKQPFMVKVQFLCVAGTGLLEVFMCVLPADHLLDISKNITQEVYESKWYEQTLKMQRNVLFMLMPQKPVTVKVRCVIPTLSLSYFCSYISNVFSLFTALRIMVMKHEDYGSNEKLEMW
ncbi:uncharacterized protein LOC143181408 [Calliopsis andreniformis]|uniref:uncharacterized protein LOC143181408 n=1 Tax=Calliopsis andreniformis TaxID=337506 RepID=UPI003FCE5BE0